jgi:hypothetical protein
MITREPSSILEGADAFGFLIVTHGWNETWLSKVLSRGGYLDQGHSTLVPGECWNIGLGGTRHLDVAFR